MHSFPLKDQARPARVRGFSLLELMVTLFVVSILLAAAVPSLRHAMHSTSLSGTSNDLVADLKTARTEAASRGTEVAVAASSGDWNNGWNIVVPPATSTDTEVTVRVRAAPKDQIQVKLTAKSGATNRIVFKPQGSLDSPTSPCFKLERADDAHLQPLYIDIQGSGSLRQFEGKSGVAPICGG